MLTYAGDGDTKLAGRIAEAGGIEAVAAAMAAHKTSATRYSIYLLYWYKSTKTYAARRLGAQSARVARAYSGVISSTAEGAGGDRRLRPARRVRWFTLYNKSMRFTCFTLYKRMRFTCFTRTKYKY